MLFWACGSSFDPQNSIFQDSEPNEGIIPNFCCRNGFNVGDGSEAKKEKDKTTFWYPTWMPQTPQAGTGDSVG